MEKTPKSLRKQIGFFGRTNVGKSSLLNYLVGQDVSVISPLAGTTTDIVEKTMELLPVGPVVLLDTAGIDDASALAEARMKKTLSAYARADIFVIVVESGRWTGFEDSLIEQAAKRGCACVLVINKTDIAAPLPEFVDLCKKKSPYVMLCSCADADSREKSETEFRNLIAQSLKNSGDGELAIVGDLVPPGGVVVLVVPIDLQAPKGRLILPQVQTIRDTLDNDASVVVVKEREYADLLTKLNVKPDLVVCDSQVVLKVVADTPADIPCTTFSILFSRNKGDLQLQAQGLAIIDSLKLGDKILVAEACSHHALADDIGRVKIPRWLRQYTGLDLHIDVYSGRDFPDNLSDYSLIVHCGSCMLTRNETQARLLTAKQANTPITNYGLCISFIQGVVHRVLAPFPAALDAFTRSRQQYKKDVYNDDTNLA